MPFCLQKGMPLLIMVYYLFILRFTVSAALLMPFIAVSPAFIIDLPAVSAMLLMVLEVSTVVVELVEESEEVELPVVLHYMRQMRQLLKPIKAFSL